MLSRVGEGGVSFTKERLGDGGFAGGECKLEISISQYYSLMIGGGERTFSRKVIAGDLPTASTRYHKTCAM